MAGIQTSTGLISGVPIQDTVDKLMAISAQPRDRLNSLNTSLKNQQVAVGQLTALVIGIQLSTDQLGKSTLFTQTKVQSSGSAISVSASDSAVAGKYQFVPVQLASQQQYTSSLLASSDQLVGAGQIEVHAGGFLDNSVRLDELNGGAGVTRGQIRITDRSGSSATIDLRYANTASDIVDAINSSTDIRVAAKLDGDRFTLVDSSGGSGTLSVSEVGGGVTARDLGLASISTTNASASGNDVLSLSRSTSLRSLLDGRGVQLAGKDDASLNVSLADGTSFTFKTALTSNTSSVGQLIDAINTAGAGKVQASINSSGDGIKLQDLTSGSSAFAVTSSKGTLARDLGWDKTSVGGVLDGAQLQSGLGDVLLSSLNGGAGLGTLGDLTLTDRSGATATVNLSAAKTLGQVLNTLNASGIGLAARLNDSRTGIVLVDTTGGSAASVSAVSNDASGTAAKLGFTASSDPARLAGKSLERQWINENTLLADWDQGRGLKLSSLKFTNSDGKVSAVNFSQSTPPKTIGEVLRTINASAKGFEARINETGDGLLLVDTAGGGGDLKVEDVGSGTTAKQLKIAGTSKSLTVGNASVKGIDGKLDFTITTTATDTVASLVTKLNEADDSLSASLLSLGNSGVRLAISSAATGARGRLAFDTSSLTISLAETAKAQDALLSVSGGVLVSSSSNKFEGVAPGLTLTVNDATRTTVTVDVTKDNDALTKQVSAMVDQFNKLKDKLNDLTAFDSSTFSTGVLFGTTAALRVDIAFTQLFSGRHSTGSSIRSVSEIGVSFNDQGKLEFDKDKFLQAYNRDPDAVKTFFSAETKGFSVKAKAVADSLAGTKGGTLIQRNTTLQTTIEFNAKRIDEWTSRLDTQRTRMLTQFYAMETAISKSQNNLSIINNIQNLTA